MLTKLIKNSWWTFVRFTALPLLGREIFLSNKVLIITYHDPEPHIFRKHMKYLSKHYNFISLNKFVDAIETKDDSKLPSKSLIVTFDDGHKTNYELVDTFKKYKVIPTIFLCSHIVNTNRRFWWKTNYQDHNSLKNKTYSDMYRELEDSVGYFPEKEYNGRQALNLAEIDEMKSFTDFQAHSKFHPILTKCDAAKCLDEIKNSKKYLEQLLNNKIEHFSYPDGKYGNREKEYVKQTGYKSARSMDWGWNTILSDQFELKVIVINDDVSVNKLSAQLSGCFRLLQLSARKLRNTYSRFVNIITINFQYHI